MSTTTKLLKIIFISIIALGFTGDTKNSIGKITFILGKPGEVTILNQNQANWSNARLYSQVFNGDIIKTEREARCEIKLKDQSLIRIGENSTFCLKRNSSGSNKDSKLSFGRIWFNIKTLMKGDRFTIKSPSAVCSIRGTILRMEADSSTRIAVYDGAVDVGPEWGAQKQIQQQQDQEKSLKPYEVPGPHEIPPPFEITLDQWIRIVQGYQIEIRSDGKYAKTKINEAEDSKLDWVKWNQMRDKLAE